MEIKEDFALELLFLLRSENFVLDFVANLRRLPDLTVYSYWPFLKGMA